MPDKSKMYVVKLEDGCWLAPCRTCSLNNAKVYDCISAAKIDLLFARKLRPFKNGKVMRYDIAYTEELKGDA